MRLTYQKKKEKCKQKSGTSDKPTRLEKSVEDDYTLVDPVEEGELSYELDATDPDQSLSEE